MVKGGVKRLVKNKRRRLRSRGDWLKGGVKRAIQEQDKAVEDQG